MKEKRKESKEGKRGIVKTSNLVTVLKKATCTAGPLRAAGPHCSRVAVVDTSSWTCSHSFTGQSRAVHVLRLQWWRHSRPFSYSAGASVREGRVDRPDGRGKNTKRLVSNKKENSSLYIVVLVQYKQNKKSLLLMVSKHPILKRRRGGAQQVDEDPQWLAGCLALRPSPRRQRAQL